MSASAARADPFCAARREAEIRQALNETVAASEAKLAELKTIIEKYTDIHAQLRRSERTLSIKANQYVKGMREMENQIKAIQDYLERCREVHEKTLSSISQPSWAVPHHYHMTSIEHSMGHSQPHVLEVGDMIRGHLHIYAMANCTTSYRKQAQIHLSKANADRAKAADKVKQAYVQLRRVRAQIIKTLDMLNRAAKTVGSSRMQELRKDTAGGATQRAEKPRNAGGSRAASVVASRGKYLGIKMRYLSSLNIEQNVEVTSSMVAAGKSGDDAKAAADAKIFELTPKQIAAYDTDMSQLRSLLADYTRLTLDKKRMVSKLERAIGAREQNLGRGGAPRRQNPRRVGPNAAAAAMAARRRGGRGFRGSAAGQNGDG